MISLNIYVHVIIKDVHKGSNDITYHYTQQWKSRKIKFMMRTLRPKRENVTRCRRKLYNEDFRKLYSSPNIIKLIKSRTMTWVGHVVRTGEIKF